MPKKPTIFTYEDALATSIEYFKGDELAAKVFLQKYALKDLEGNILESNPDMMHKRISKELARIELKYDNPLSEETIYNAIKDFKYLVPQGSPMNGIGNDYQVTSLSNCFVIGNESDSYGGIMQVDEQLVQLSKRRAGIGTDLSHIRPKGSIVQNAALTSTGIVPFMERYSSSINEVAQDGRRGALMLTVSIDHPDSESFIDAKMDGTKVTGANVSVKITDKFMNSVKNGKEFVQQFPIDAIHPTFTQTTDAKKLWDKIIHNAWKSAEPGVLFWDTVINESIPDCYADLGFKTVSTNPCGEITLCKSDSCRLLAINLYSFVEHPFTEDAYFNNTKFVEYVTMAQRLMDDIVDLELEKIDKILAKIETDVESDSIKKAEKDLWLDIKLKCEQGRRTGLGITAEGDMLAALNIQYGTTDATDFSTSIHKTLALTAYRSSVTLAKERGAFPLYDADREDGNPMILRIMNSDLELYEDMVKYGRRHIALLTIAPTGTTSMMTQTSSGIEPVFMVSYKRRKKVNPNDKNVTVSFVDEVGISWEEYHVFHHKFETWLEINGYDVETVKQLSDKKLADIVATSPYHNATANDIDWVEKVRLQGSIQKWIDHSISVTVNVPNDCTEELISEIYMTAWEVGCKGMTVYRDGSRSGVLVSNDDNQKESKDTNKFQENNAPKRPKKLEAQVIKFNNNKEKWVGVIGMLDNHPYEIFTGRIEESFGIFNQNIDSGWIIKNKDLDGNSRYDFQYQDSDGYMTTVESLNRTFNKEYWNYTKLISSLLRHKMPLPSLIDVISSLNLDGNNINSWKNGIIRTIKRFIKDGAKISKSKNVCPSCKSVGTLVYQEGCLRCEDCGHSKCG